METIDYLFANEFATDGNGNYAYKSRDPHTGMSYYVSIPYNQIDGMIHTVSDFEEKIG